MAKGRKKTQSPRETRPRHPGLRSRTAAPRPKQKEPRRQDCPDRDCPDGPAPCLPPSTRQRLLEAAGHVFADCGLKDATVRDICTRADANIAAINYHFKGKESLYLHVVDYAHEQMSHGKPMVLDADAPAIQRLQQFIQAFIARVLDPNSPSWHARLMLREMVEPSAALDRLIENTIRPTFGILRGILLELNPDLDADGLRLCTISIIGQCLMHRHCEPVLARLFPCCERTPEELTRIAAHVYCFSTGGLAAIQECRAGAATSPSRRKGKGGRTR